jgi:hypothetical protein
MGIQVHRTLVQQHAHALGKLKKLIRQQAPHSEILVQQQFAESLARVIDHQEIDEDWDRQHAVEPRPKRQYFPKGAYRRDTLNILRRAVKLAQGNWALIQQGLVERVDKEADHRSASCLYVVKR